MAELCQSHLLASNKNQNAQTLQPTHAAIGTDPGKAHAGSESKGGRCNRVDDSRNLGTAYVLTQGDKEISGVPVLTGQCSEPGVWWFRGAGCLLGIDMKIPLRNAGHIVK